MTKITRKEAQKAYDEGNPIMTDAEFDATFAENSGALGTAGKVAHVQPMLSQKKCHSAGDVEAFLLKLIRVHDETTTGRTGRLTPVATIKPVRLDGATITSVSLGSVQCMIESGIHTGSRVIVTRQGGVVPKIIKVMNENT